LGWRDMGISFHDIGMGPIILSSSVMPSRL
jgi:hypothetical protein